MTVTIITPTADQPLGIHLLEGYMRRQTVQPDQWIVADDGVTHANLTAGQTHLKRRRTHEGGRSLAGNILAALPHSEGDVVLIMEHDDWYAPDHIETCLRRLSQERALCTGSRWQRYYNVKQRCWLHVKNVGSALCNTAFDRRLLPVMQRAAEEAMRTGSYGVDRLFWDSASGRDTHDVDTVVGIKGLPGRLGLGMGHRPDPRRWTADPHGHKLQEWVGADAGHYGV